MGPHGCVLSRPMTVFLPSFSSSAGPAKGPREGCVIGPSQRVLFRRRARAARPEERRRAEYQLQEHW